MNQKLKVELTTYGLDSSRLGLVSAVLTARSLRPSHTISGNDKTWAGEIPSSQIDELIAAILKLGDVRFDVITRTEFDAHRFAYSPRLGLKSCAIDSFGNAIVQEHRIRELLRQANQNIIKFERLIASECLEEWNSDFEEALEQSMTEKSAVGVA